ncbi:MAG TPA: SCO family protein [Polyangiaceae bacterium]|jgi:protein SCO1/2|nr:SCO family protein [Polyangiaceae bacterium]
MTVAARWRRLASLALAAALLALAACHSQPDLPSYGAVPGFALTDQAGTPFTRDALAGTTWVAAFVFTRCPSACPRVTRAMQELQLKLKQRNAKVRLVSFSVDPEFDTPPVLRRYADEYKADTGTWSFVTGDSDTIRKTAEQGLKIAADGKADPTKADFGITHGTQLVLVDGEGRIRGYYASNDAEALARLLDDATRLSS